MTAERAHRSPILDYAASPAPSKRGKGFLAVCASVLLPGLGQFFAGYRRRGLIWLLVVLSVDTLAFTSLCLPDFVPAIMVLGPIATITHLSCWVDSYLCGRRSAKDHFRFAVWRYATGLGLLVLGIVLAPQGRVAELLKARVVEAFQTPTASMSPTLVPGDRFLCHKRLAPTRWSVVVIDSPLMQSKQITRLVGLPGETIEIIGGRVHCEWKTRFPTCRSGSLHRQLGRQVALRGDRLRRNSDHTQS